MIPNTHLAHHLCGKAEAFDTLVKSFATANERLAWKGIIALDAYRLQYVNTNYLEALLKVKPLSIARTGCPSINIFSFIGSERQSIEKIIQLIQNHTYPEKHQHNKHAHLAYLYEISSNNSQALKHWETVIQLKAKQDDASSQRYWHLCYAVALYHLKDSESALAAITEIEKNLIDSLSKPAEGKKNNDYQLNRLQFIKKRLLEIQSSEDSSN